MIWIGGSGNHHDTALQNPSKDNLRGGHPVRADNRRDSFIRQQLLRIAPSARFRGSQSSVRARKKPPFPEAFGPREPMSSFFHPLCEAGWCPAGCVCRPLASKTGAWHSSHGPGLHFSKCGENRRTVANPRWLLKV